MNIPELPKRPLELTELEGRCAKIRAERQKIQDKLACIQDEAWITSQSSEDPLNHAAELLATGATEATSRTVLPEQVSTMQARLDLLRRAEQKVAQLIAEQRERHNRAIAATLRPLHRRAVQRVCKALLALEAANAEEVAVRAAVPGLPMQACDFPNIGRRGPGGGPIQFWLEFARRQGLLDEDAATWPSAAY